MTQGYKKLSFLIGKHNVEKLKDITDERGRVYIPYTSNSNNKLNSCISQDLVEILVEEFGGERVQIKHTNNTFLEKVIRACIKENINKSYIYSCVRADYEEVDEIYKKVLAETP
ncbi:hypothetical protein [Francisella philomiragia]|uniref:Uncharacterized protein n=1 Tax=Francisella philomiragia TaxID=28110 RepID=A0A0B6D477_9GAMM|nr:hypothetical protein [Francisella philomiragia]AJI52438.1 hypothetical protein LA55_1242 [Francisella philomiragia]